MSTDRLEARVSDLERYFKMLVEMMRRHDERLDDIQAEQSNADVRIAALADAQIKTEEALTTLTVRVDRLSEIVERFIEGRNGNSKSVSEK